ncbi:hypothetical protein ABZ192_02530 [Streptomyces sp. NPDC006235]|uniref:hypothetical protein n=1 Tax=Streptomyces sp. NPDC006235 TaxID=3156736 RepID=UPI00339F0C17
MIRPGHLIAHQTARVRGTDLDGAWTARWQRRSPAPSPRAPRRCPERWPRWWDQHRSTVLTSGVADVGATFQQALIATVLANLGFAVTIVPAGLLSDLLGRRAVMLTGPYARPWRPP